MKIYEIVWEDITSFENSQTFEQLERENCIKRNSLGYLVYENKRYGNT